MYHKFQDITWEEKQVQKQIVVCYLTWREEKSSALLSPDQPPATLAQHMMDTVGMSVVPLSNISSETGEAPLKVMSLHNYYCNVPSRLSIPLWQTKYAKCHM